jgi:lysophospholipid acyltransferase (LPLAT)-like uncharacterized protein
VSETQPEPELSLGRRLLLGAAPPLAALLINGTRATSDLTRLHPERMDALVEADQRFIMAFWHCKLFLMTHAYRGKRLAAMISRHFDGELIARTVKLMGRESVRGSSTRGGSEALRAGLRWLRDEGDLSITPDGPKGPARAIKPGVLELARLSGAPAFPMSLAYSRCRRLKSWDRFEVPYPFGRVCIGYGEPLEVPKRAGEAERETLRTELRSRIDALTAECRESLGLPPNGDEANEAVS